MIVLPTLLLSFWLVLQYSLAAHVRHAAQAAAGDAALAAAAGSGDPDATARDLLDEAVGSLTSGVRVASTIGADEVTVRIDVDVLQVFPIGDFDVAVSAAAPIERFVAEPERPMVGRCRGDRGDSGPLEMVILLPAILLLFGMVVAFGRATTASQHVEHAAAVGARAAAGAQRPVGPAPSPPMSSVAASLSTT